MRSYVVLFTAVLLICCLPARNATAESEPGWVDNPTYSIHDRCMACHQIEAQAAEHRAPPPDRFHSPALLRAHPVTSFGCAVCHGGDAEAGSKEDAHGRGSVGSQQLLTGLQAQSRCVRCHQGGGVSGTEFLARGLELIDDRACFACHEIPGGDRRARKAPNLDQIAKKVYPGWLNAWLADPSSYSETSRMPDFQLRAEQAEAITSYLFAGAVETTGAARASRPAADTRDKSPLDRAEARRLLKRSACLDCHRIRGAGGGAPGVRAPDLSHVGDKIRADWIESWLREGPQHMQPGAGMPSFRFPEQQAKLLARYLTQTFRTRDGTNRARTPLATSPEAVGEGQRLFRGLGCLNCHARRGEPAVEKIGPDLRHVGDRDVHGVYWPGMGENWNMRLTSYLRTKVSRPRAFSSSHRMPDFHFEPEQTEAIVVALMSFSANPIPEAARLGSERIDLARWLPRGPAAAVFERFQCLQCHSLRGAFGELAPDLGWEGDRVHRSWLIDFLQDPYLIRPALDARMPDLGLTSEEAASVADYAESTLWDEAVPADPFDGAAPAQDVVERGRGLFWDEYECIYCHMVDGEGETDGPDLTAVGSRLQAGWLYQWVIDPQRFYESDMDAQGVSPEEARAITAYLLTLRGEEGP